MPGYNITYADAPNESGATAVRVAIVSLVALLILAALISGGLLLAQNDGSASDSLEAATSGAGAQDFFATGIIAAYRSNTDTLFLVDASSSITTAGYLDEIVDALQLLALPEQRKKVKNARASLMTFGGPEDPELIIADANLQEQDSANQWLLAADELQAQGSGTFIYNALNHAVNNLIGQQDDNDGNRTPAVVIISDGIDLAKGDCRPRTPAEADTILDFCPDENGDPVRCTAEQRKTLADPTTKVEICEVIGSKTIPSELVRKMNLVDMKLYVMAYGNTKDHAILKELAEQTGGAYTYR